ncbi:MAG: hypothetical protein QOH70_2064 [Blastocatellia bacterium]|jgi:hypothetical protein|nr:hypothetical protein [Blastocatellia bacterium]
MTPEEVSQDEKGLTLSLATFGKDFVDSYSYGPKASDTILHCADYSSEEEIRKPNCIPITFSIDCSAKEIRKGVIVECKVKFPGGRQDFRPTLTWTVSAGASQSSVTATSIKVSLADSRKPKIRVTVKVVSPSICSDTASMELQVVKPKIRPKRH